MSGLGEEDDLGDALVVALPRVKELLGQEALLRRLFSVQVNLKRGHVNITTLPNNESVSLRINQLVLEL